jgi:hypothetical protein
MNSGIALIYLGLGLLVVAWGSGFFKRLHVYVPYWMSNVQVGLFLVGAYLVWPLTILVLLGLVAAHALGQEFRKE